jgi:hypothetical protein
MEPTGDALVDALAACEVDAAKAAVDAEREAIAVEVEDACYRLVQKIRKRGAGK